MVSGFDIWGHDAGLRRHWKNRALAFIVDALLSFVPALTILYLMEMSDILEVGLIVSFTFYLVSIIPESLTGSSVGKGLFHLKVHPVKGESLSGRVCVRNISRLLWFALPPLDFAIGMATRGDPRQKLLDRVAGTKVVHRAEAEKHQKHLQSVTEPENKTLKQESESGTSEDACLECGGKLIMLPDQKLQCEKCGLIQ